MYTYNDTMTTDVTSGLLAGLGIILILIFIIAIPIIIVNIIATWKLFKKGGKKGWESLIPFYGTFVLIEICGLNWWYFLIAISGTILTFIGIENLSTITYIASMFVNFLCFYNLAKKAHKNEILYGILGALVSFIPLWILAFSKKVTFDNSVAVSPNGIFGAPKENNYQAQPNNQTQGTEKYCIGCGQRLSNDVLFCQNCGRRVEEPAVTPVQQPVQPTQEPVTPVQQFEQPVMPTQETTEPVQQPVQPTQEPVTPVQQFEQPVMPTQETTEPVQQPEQPLQ